MGIKESRVGDLKGSRLSVCSMIPLPEVSGISQELCEKFREACDNI